MSREQTSFPVWLPTMLILAAAIAFIATDPAGLASRFASFEFGAFRALRWAGGSLRWVDSIPAQILLLETIGAALVLLIAARRFSWAIGVAVAGALAAQLASFLLFVHVSALFDTINASAAMLLAAIAGLFAQPFGKIESRSRMAASLAPHAPSTKAEVAPLAQAPKGEALVLTTLSCGLRRAPALARFFENDAPGFMRLVESIIEPLRDDAAKHGAWISAFDGASFAAQWPAGDDGAGADRACDSAGRMLAMVAKANERLAQQWPQGETPCPTLEIGIGLTTARHFAGAVRAGGRSEPCLVPIGGVTAERLRDLSENYGSAAVAEQALGAAVRRGYAFLEVDFLAPDLGSDAVRLYALLGNALVQASPKFRAVATFHDHIFQSIRSRQWEKARGLIAQCRRISGANPKLYDLHLARIAWYETNPPPSDWDGAFRPPLR